MKRDILVGIAFGLAGAIVVPLACILVAVATMLLGVGLP
jgi:hypothetical protein